jgi:fatty acid desaturase
MVSFDQNIVLPPETKDRVDTIIQILNALYHKFPDLSAPIDTATAVNALESIERIFSNADPILQHIDALMQAIQALAIIMALLLFFLVISAMVGLVLCYLTWKKVGAAKANMGCQCDKQTEKKLE